MYLIFAFYIIDHLLGGDDNIWTVYAMHIQQKKILLYKYTYNMSMLNYIKRANSQGMFMKKLVMTNRHVLAGGAKVVRRWRANY
jgi:hypothetical protein